MSGALLALIALTVACGQKAPASPDGPVTTSTAATITITAAGVDRKTVEIALGDRVLFVNNDGQPHFIASDPHPDHTDCPSINQAGFLLPGQRRETGNFVTARACGFHDHDEPLNKSLWGTITAK